jgi:peptide/nickel transport system ATP-binding protein
MSGILLDIRDVTINYATERGVVPAVRHVNLSVSHGEVLGLVGESGSGKSSLVSAMLALLPRNASAAGELFFNGEDVFKLSAREQRRLRGKAIAAISQDPFTALNPVMAIERQLVEFQHHRTDLTRREKRLRALDMLTRVGLSDPGVRMRQYPHQLSGGIRQRIAIAAALLATPRLLIADEPTTALDATTEVQVIEIIRESRSLVDGSIVFVTHDMGLVGEICDRVAVMYGGELVETGPVADVFRNPSHPYTRALLECDPARIEVPTRHLPTIGGLVPAPGALPAGCIFSPRCAAALDICRTTAPKFVAHENGRAAACHRIAA